MTGYPDARRLEKRVAYDFFREMFVNLDPEQAFRKHFCFDKLPDDLETLQDQTIYTYSTLPYFLIPFIKTDKSYKTVDLDTLL